MSDVLSYVLVTPYTVAKGRTGGIVGRLLLQSQLDLVGAQLFAPDEALTHGYAERLRAQAPDGVNVLADYVEANFLPPPGGEKRRALLLLFRGEDACRKLQAVCGHIHPEHRTLEDVHGQTIRDTYADFMALPGAQDKYQYFEPAVLTPRNEREAAECLSLFARCAGAQDNIVSGAKREGEERTLVIIKPDNWKIPSARPGEIIDMFSRSGLRIVGIKVFRFSLACALEFYADVAAALRNKLAPVFGTKAKACLEKEFNVTLSAETEKALGESFGVEYARDQFEQIVEFMSGWRPGTCPAGKEKEPGTVKCMILVYEGEDAVEKIRAILGPTDPSKAPAGTVRREFGSNVMVNTAHASDSPKSFERESAIVSINENSLAAVIRDALKENAGNAA